MINYSVLFLADGPCHQLRLSAVLWKGRTEPPHQSALIGYNCGFVPFQDPGVTAQDSCQGPQLLMRTRSLMCVRPSAGIRWGISAGSKVPIMKMAGVGGQFLSN